MSTHIRDPGENLPIRSGHDAFVSYAHSDNEVALGGSVAFGWVTTLTENLNRAPNVYKKDFFIDHQLKPGDAFGTDLLNKVSQSSLLVLLLSQNYIDSEWCGKELEQFIHAHNKDADNLSDVYVVELSPFEDFTNVPENIKRLRKQLIHAKFWHRPPDSSAPSLAGYPSPLDGGSQARDHYWSNVNQLRFALDTRLRALQQLPQQATGNTAIYPAKNGHAGNLPKASLGTVLLADTTDDLEAQRNLVKTALEPEGIVVLPEGDYVGLTPQEFEAALKADLARADLFVQLLSPTAGRKGKGFETPLPQLQYQRAIAAAKPVLQWCERLPSDGQIADSGHSKLFLTEFIRATNLSSFETAIVERLQADKERRRLSEASGQSSQAAASTQRKLLFVDDLANEQMLSARLLAIIREQNWAVRSMPMNAPLGSNGIDVKELLRPCRAGITVYADSGKHTKAFNRLVYFLNQVAEGSLSLARWGVYSPAGTIASEFGIVSDEVVQIDEHGLVDFLRSA